MKSIAIVEGTDYIDALKLFKDTRNLTAFDVTGILHI